MSTQAAPEIEGLKVVKLSHPWSSSLGVVGYLRNCSKRHHSTDMHPMPGRHRKSSVDTGTKAVLLFFGSVAFWSCLLLLRMPYTP